MSAKLPSIPLIICKLWKYICGCFPFLIYFRDTVSVARLPPSFICKLCKYMRVPHINIIYLTLGAHCILYVYCTSYNVVCWCLVYSLQGLSVDSVTSSPPPCICRSLSPSCWSLSQISTSIYPQRNGTLITT